LIIGNQLRLSCKISFQNDFALFGVSHDTLAERKKHLPLVFQVMAVQKGRKPPLNWRLDLTEHSMFP